MKRVRRAWLAAAGVAACASCALAAPLVVTGQNGSVALGEPTLSFVGINGVQGVGAAGMSSPAGIWSNGQMLVVADAGNNRVKIYNTVPAGNGVAADVIIGQPDSASNLANQGGAAAANTLSSPSGVFVDPTGRLYVADRGNNRVLIFNAIPNADNTPADVVVGQAGFGAALANQGGAAAANTLSSPSSVWSDGVVLYVADQGNNRVLLFSAVPAANNASANFVVGQAAFNGASANQGSTVKAFTLSSPASVASDGTSLYVADQGNNRVLIYNPVPSANDVSASTAVGQVLLTSSTVNEGGSVKANTLSAPNGVCSDGTRLIVSDGGNNRVLIYGSVPAANNASASVVVGQPSMTAASANQGGSAPTASSLSHPAAVSFDGTALYVSDGSNNRALIYGALPGSNDAAASIVSGQSNMTTGTANQAVTSPCACGQFHPQAVRTDGAKVYVADRFNNRVLIYNTLPKLSGALADVVVGQVVMSAGSSNQGGLVGAGTLSFPAAAFSDGSKLYVADQINSRVLIYNAIPSANGAPASVVVGQTVLTSSGSNQGVAAAANTLSFPSDVYSDGAKLYVADRSNNRVLIYNSIPSSNNASANVALGQSNMTNHGVNQGGLGAATLDLPNGVYADAAHVYVADQFNNRVLIYNLPVVTGQAASVVVGQPNFTSNAINQGHAAGANTLSRPTAVYSDGVSLYIADQGNSRVLVYNTIPTSNNAAADYVLGQTTATASRPNLAGSLAANTLSAPGGVSVDPASGRILVADTNNNRTVLYEPASVAAVSATGGTASFAPPFGPSAISAQVPSNAYGAPINMTFTVNTSFPAATSPTATLVPSGVGVEIDTDQASQPSAFVPLTVGYRLADVAGLDRGKLVLARYDPLSQVWVPLPSVSDTANNQVVSQTNHFSLFQIMQVDPSANSASTVKAFPNPLRPSVGPSFMTFAGAPAGARIRIYTVAGVRVRDLSADGTGMAKWDGTNDAGATVASGVYFAYVQGGGSSKVVKLGVQR